MTQPAQPTHDHEFAQQPTARQPVPLWRRIGCGVALVVWFTVLLLPFAMFWLASGQTISIPRRGVPDAQDHPVIEIRLIMEIENRGLQIKMSDVITTTDANICLQTNVRFFLWQSESTEGQSATYCDCYDAEQRLLSSTTGSCVLDALQ